MELEPALRRLAGRERLLVASDYDGVLALIVADPERAVPLPGAVETLRELARLPATVVAAVSGRARESLARVSGLPPAEVVLVGSHGAELVGELVLTDAQRQLRDRLIGELRRLVADRPGVGLELKPASVVLHTRTAADRRDAAEVTAAVLAGPATWPGVHATPGKEVVELSVVPADKGAAVTALRQRHRVDAVLYLGDDVTDERVFVVLDADDVGVKVGPGDTAARYRVPDPPAALDLLRRLHQLRATGCTAR